MKLAFKVLAALGALALIAVAIAVVSVYGTTTTALQNQISANQLEITRQSMDKVDRFLYERRDDLSAFAQREQLHHFLLPTPAGRSTLAQITKVLTDRRDLSASWADFGVIDTKGKTVASSDKDDLTTGILTEHSSMPDLYKRALAGEAVTSDVFRNDHDKTAMIVFMAPVKDSGKVIGVVQGELRWAKVLDILKEVKGTTVRLLNHDGVLIASNQDKDDAKLLATNYKDTAMFGQLQHNKEGSAVGADLENSKAQAVTTYISQAGFESYKGNGWYLTLSTPTDAAFASARSQSLFLVGVYLAIVTVLMASIAVVLHRVMVRPLRTLSAGISRVALGDLSQDVEVRSRDEIGVLSKNFNEMIRQLAATHRSLEAASIQLEASIEGLHQGFMLTDVSGNVVMANESAHKMMQDQGPADKAKEHKAITIEAIVALLPAEIHLTTSIEATIKERKSARFVNLALGGRFINLYLTPVVGDGAAAIGCVLLFEDVTEERILQRSRDEFFSIASHELRTPLTAIRGNTSMIQTYYPEVLKDPGMKEMVDDIHDSAIRLIEIVNDFLDVSRLEQKKVKFSLEAFPIENIIEKIIYELTGVSRDKKIYIKFDQKTLGNIPQVFADQNRTKQVIYNLVGNSMKFTEKGGVSIACQVKGNFLKVSVTDTGPGLSPESQQLLFHKFQQATSSTLTRDNTRGTGLGLYISKLLMEGMGGDVGLEWSEVGKGTTFSFTLPLATHQQIEWAQAKAVQLAATQPAAANPVASTTATAPASAAPATPAATPAPEAAAANPAPAAPASALAPAPAPKAAAKPTAKPADKPASKTKPQSKASNASSQLKKDV